jgi:hypothetical protein
MRGIVVPVVACRRLCAMVGMMLFGGPEQEPIPRLWEQRLAEPEVDVQDERQVVKRERR